MHVHVTDAVGVPHHRDPGIAHNVLDKRVAAPGNDQVDQMVQIEDGLHVLPRLHQMHPPVRNAGQAPCRRNEDVRQRAIGMKRLAAPLQQRRVARLHAKRGNLHERVRP